jgi:hypothetical protein
MNNLNMKRFFSLSFVVLVGFLCFSHEIAYAGRGAGAIVGSIGAAFLTKEALDATTCAKYRNDGDTYVCPGAVADSLNAEAKVLDGSSTALDQEGTVLEREGDSVDLYSEYAVNSYNSKLERYRAKVSQFNVSIDAYNRKLASSCEPVTSACAGLFSDSSSVVQNESNYEATGFGVDSWIVIFGVLALIYAVYKKFK